MSHPCKDRESRRNERERVSNQGMASGGPDPLCEIAKHLSEYTLRASGNGIRIVAPPHLAG